MPPPVLPDLLELTARHPTARKLLVCPTLNWGREWLRVLAMEAGVWIGWEPVTLRALASELAQVPLERWGLRVASDMALEVAVGAAIGSAVRAGEVVGPLRELVGSGGTRRAVTDAVLELRMAGVAPAELREAGGGPTAHSLAAILERYREEIALRRRADPALVFETALAHLAEEGPCVLPEVVVLAPGLAPRGLPAQLDQALRARGAIRMPAAPGDEGAAPAVPGLECFRAATPSDELREVLRRAAAHGWPDDQIELVTTDPDAHGVALDALCRATGARATMLRGVPLVRTRIGRALERWLAWLEEDLAADRIREALEAGEIACPVQGPDAGTLARELRALQVGWGRRQWEAVRTLLGSPAWVTDRVRRSAEDEDTTTDALRRRQEAEAIAVGLRWLLDTILLHAPDVPERGRAEAHRTTVQRIAVAALGWLRLVPVEGAAEQRTMERLARRLDELATEPDGELPFGAALASVRHAMADLRAWTDTAPERQPWASAGGHLHLTDLAHAGATGRPHLVLLGLDAERVAGGATGNALLPDAMRHRLGADRLATTDDRRRERAGQVHQALAMAAARAAAGGSGLVSWSIASDLTGRKAAPAPAVLEAVRAARGEPGLTFEQLRALVGVPACAVPAAAGPLDARDLWLAALAGERQLQDGTALVGARWPALVEAAPSPGVRMPGAAPDPFQPGSRPFSPTALERLSQCPLAWFYRYALDLVPPQDPEYDRQRWLDPMTRGLALHRIFERAGHQFRRRQESLDAATVRSELLAIVDEVADEWRAHAPAPSEAVFQAERDELSESAVAWLEMEREAAAQRHAPRWVAFELKLDGALATFPLPDGRRLPVVGRVDRVDEHPDGRLRAVDYKTGKPDRYRPEPKRGALRGGRLLQPALYAAALSAMQGGRPTDFAYHFPTPAGQGTRIVYGPEAQAAAARVVSGLVDDLAAGRFLPTLDASDCAWCDYRDICRVRVTEYGNVESSPRAEAAAAAVDDEAWAAMRARRTPEDA